MTCECERSATPSMAQVLHIANGDTVNQKLAARQSLSNSPPRLRRRTSSMRRTSA